MGRALRAIRVRLGQALRTRVLAALALFGGLAGVMLYAARDVPQYGGTFALNIGAELVAALILLFALTPILRRAQQGGVREHRRLDFAWYVDRVLAAKNDVRVLHTFSRLFGEPHDRRFLTAATGVLRRHGRVEILLLDPDSPAAAQRTKELRGHGDVAREVRQNLRVLAAFRQDLDGSMRERFEVRLYTAAPSVAIYQWDERLLASFLPLGVLSGDSTQLEVSVLSPLGSFVAERFDELWQNSTPLDAYLCLPVAVQDGRGSHPHATPFVVADGERYLADGQLLARLARSLGQGVRVTLPEAPGRAYLLEMVPEESPLGLDLAQRFLDKYARHESAFIRLAPDPAGGGSSATG
ncbi:MAG TPA: hypothetical protein VES42_07125 [Pilimelia sp.]|nr:hypothetical protein [Pilimelia sp.]